MRAYHFGNFYMSSIQQGIQAEHAAVRMAVRLRCDKGKKADIFWDWAAFNETVILLKGGMDCDLKDIGNFLSYSDNPYPFGTFRESKEAMDSMLTNVMVILPPKIYDVAAQVRRRNITFSGDFPVISNFDLDDETLAICTSMIDSHGKYSEFERELINRLNRYQLAS